MSYSSSKINKPLKTYLTPQQQKQTESYSGRRLFTKCLNESFSPLVVIDESYEKLNDLEQSLRRKLDDYDLWPEDLYFEEDGLKLRLNITVDGDWKHDHAAIDEAVKEFCNAENLNILETDSDVIEEDGTDSYKAIHTWLLDNEKITETFLEAADPLDEDTDLLETYSEEELKELVGKTFNQQKIQNIYRRKKYDDMRLFAHTKCTNCGREKRVFLSNLINDPEKYGSCTCSDTNVESRLDNIEDLYSGSKKLSSNTSGYTGVTHIATSQGRIYDKWRAYIEIDGKRTYLGDFSSKSAAVRARKKAAEKGLKWYREHKNEFMKNYRRKSKRYRNLRRKRSKK